MATWRSGWPRGDLGGHVAIWVATWRSGWPRGDLGARSVRGRPESVSYCESDFLNLLRAACVARTFLLNTCQICWVARHALDPSGARGLCSTSVVSMPMSLACPASVLVRARLDQGARIAQAYLFQWSCALWCCSISLYISARGLS